MIGGNFTITSANDGGYIPETGFAPGGNFILTISGGTSIDAVLQKRNAAGNFFDVPEAGATISSTWQYEVKAATDDVFRIAVVSATGSWSGTFKPVR